MITEAVEEVKESKIRDTTELGCTRGNTNNTDINVKIEEYPETAMTVGGTGTETKTSNTIGGAGQAESTQLGISDCVIETDGCPCAAKEIIVQIPDVIDLNKALKEYSDSEKKTEESVFQPRTRRKLKSLDKPRLHSGVIPRHVFYRMLLLKLELARMLSTKNSRLNSKKPAQEILVNGSAMST